MGESSVSGIYGIFDIRGKNVLITGGAQGLGRMISEAMVRAGARVYFTTRKPDICATAEAEMRVFGECTGIPIDLAGPEGAAALARQIAESVPKLHVLINNAGRTWGAPFLQFPDKAWTSVMAINVQTPFTLIRDLVPQLKAAATAVDPARVINIGSVAGHVVERLHAYSYAASKAAIHQISKVLAEELAPENITVNTIAPGYFPTQMTAHMRADEQLRATMLGHVPLGRLGEPEDIAGMCIMLSSRAGAYITGALMAVDGGIAGCR